MEGMGDLMITFGLNKECQQFKAQSQQLDLNSQATLFIIGSVKKSPISVNRPLRIFLIFLEFDPVSPCRIPGTPGKEDQEDHDDRVGDDDAPQDAPRGVGYFVTII